MEYLFGDASPSPFDRNYIEYLTQAGPAIRAIAQHSLSPSELVLKRVLADDRREEIFASKADLLEKLAPLPPKLFRLFGPLGLDDTSEPIPLVPGSSPATAATPSTPGGTPGPEAPVRGSGAGKGPAAPTGDSVEVKLDELEQD